MIVDQPYEEKLGNLIQKKLETTTNGEFTIIVAYAKMSGIKIIYPYMETFKQNGGRIRAIIGLDQQNTSYEALKTMCGVCDEIYVYHNENPAITFHVKAYSIKDDNNYWTVIGSNNLTSGGLYGNCEAAFLNENKTNIDEMFKRYSDLKSNLCKELTIDLIEQLLENGYIKKETELRMDLIKQQRTTSKRKIKIFGQTVIDKITKQEPKVTGSKKQYYEDGVYLLKYIPKAGGRTEQVHYTKYNLENFFNKKADESIKMQEIDENGISKKIEERKVVYSLKNKNYKIEIGGARIINHVKYNTERRPILLIKKVTDDLFEYILVTDGHPGYEELRDRLETITKKGNQLQSIQLDSEEVLTLWPECPLV